MAKKIEFRLPEGFVVPEDVSKNGQFEALATIHLKDGGKACLVALDDYRMPGYKDGDKDEPEEYDGKKYADAASEGMQEGY